LGVAAIIPLGQMALWETAKADRSGACGRAAMREIEVSRLLDFRYWYWRPSPTNLGNFWGFTPPYSVIPNNRIQDVFTTVSTCTDSLPFVIDPLGRAKGMPDAFGQIRNNVFLPRRTLRTMPLSPAGAPQSIINAEQFFWNDDLPFDTIKNSSARPKQVSNTGEGSYSWFFTAMPVATEMSLPVASRRLFNVSVVVCYKRNFQVSDPNNFYPVGPTITQTFDGEHTANISSVVGFPGMGIGGGTVQLDPGSKVNVKENQWVLLYHLHLDPTTQAPIAGYPQMNRCNWYRVVGVGADTNTLSLNGPDWDPNLSAALVVVPGAIGVYTTTMELDWDPLWTK
jgi:hypothetical protein